MLCDAHLHLSDGLCQIMAENNIAGIVNCCNKEEYEKNQQLKTQYPALTLSCGVHPWYVDKCDENEIETFLKPAAIIGEIGMDCVWCNTDLQKQKTIFVLQLKIAQRDHKKVILHTKGMEKEILEMIQQFPNTYLVHWYSCMDYVEDYLKLDCYFSVGPSLLNDDAVAKVIEKVPLNRLLIETDGLAAVEWALGKSVDSKTYPEILKNSVQIISQVKELPYEVVWNQINENYRCFIK